MTNYLTDKKGQEYTPRHPFPVNDMTQSTDVVSVTSETVTFACSSAAGSAGINAFDKGPVMNITGDRVGSYWGHADNLVYTATHDSGQFRTVVETAGSAVLTIYDANRNLEQIFETESSGSLVKRYVAKVYDKSGGTLYGWISDIAVSSNVYTIDVYNNRLAETAQNWVGTLSAFDNGDLLKVEIYRYECSLAWTTGTVLTEEVGYEYTDNHLKDIDFISGLSNGQYGIDYARGRLLFRKATTGTSDTAAYTSRGSQVIVVPSGGGSDINISQIGGTTVNLDDAAFAVGADAVLPTGFLADETATDSVDEGDTGIARMTLDRKQLIASNYVLGTATYSEATTYGNVFGAVRNDTLATLVDTDNEIAPLQVNALGALYTAEQTGTLQALGTDATGADAYATVLTAGAAATHIKVNLGGSFDAIISVDGGTTDGIYVSAGEVAILDNVNIAASADIQAKNATPGSNYTGLAISIW